MDRNVRLVGMVCAIKGHLMIQTQYLCDVHLAQSFKVSRGGIVVAVSYLGKV